MVIHVEKNEEISLIFSQYKKYVLIVCDARPCRCLHSVRNDTTLETSGVDIQEYIGSCREKIHSTVHEQLTIQTSKSVE